MPFFFLARRDCDFAYEAHRLLENEMEHIFESLKSTLGRIFPYNSKLDLFILGKFALQFHVFAFDRKLQVLKNVDLALAHTVRITFLRFTFTLDFFLLLLLS